MTRDHGLHLDIGQHVGPYQIISLLGVGGMGAVYRARDTRLHRDVAFKVLLPQFSGDADFLARFAREARVLASLNHPNVAQIYGLEEANGVRGLVMELVEGPTLADRIAGGAVPVTEALDIAKQIAAAVEAAHEQGIIHRDLKPGNVKVGPDGRVKVLDFGLAKSVERSGTHDPGVSQSPTITSPAHTGAGIILGTAAYMSPEQAKGQAVGPASDVWSFGVLLFEMLAARRPFDGDDTADVLGGILRLAPRWEPLAPDVPAHVRRLLRSCLQKNPKHRLAHFQDVRLVLEGAFDASEDTRPERETRVGSRWLQAVSFVAAAVAGGLLVGVATWIRPPEIPSAVRFRYDLGEPLRFRQGYGIVAVSPDGRLVAYNTTSGLFVRALDEANARLVEGTEGATSKPFFSPDGQSVGFFESGQLRRVSLGGGSPITIAAVGSLPSSVSWAADGSIFFPQPQGIMRLRGPSGEAALVVASAQGEQLDEPRLLPDGDTLLLTVGGPRSFSASSRWDDAQVAVQSLSSGVRKTLLSNASDASYLPTGHLVYAVADGLHAVRFDLKALEVRGEPVSLVEGISRAAVSSSANYAVSADGTLFYATGTRTLSSTMPLVWVDRTGAVEAITTIRPARFAFPRLSSDDQHVLVQVDRDIRAYELATGRETRLTSDQTAGGFAEWRRDGTVAYTSSRAAPQGWTNVWMQSTDGAPTRVTMLDGQADVDAWSPDGHTLAFHHHAPAGSTDILTIRVEPALGQPRPLADGPSIERNAVFSPDGRYVAYASNETGRFEAYVRPIGETGPRRPVSVGGATSLVWARNGELIYHRSEDDAIVAVPIATAPALSIGQPATLFRVTGIAYGASAARFSVTADGKRLLMPGGEMDPAQRSPAIHVVLNWAERVRAALP
jgi:serine/threonine-protein kinase